MELTNKSELLNEVDENVSLPLETLLHILTFLNKKEHLLKAKLVSRSWYHLINANEGLIIKSINKEINSILLSQAPKHQIEVKANNLKEYVAKAKQLRAVTRFPTLTQTKITIGEQFRRENLIHCANETLLALQDRIFPRNIFGNPSPKKLILALLVVWLTVANIAYLISNYSIGHEISYTDSLQVAPGAIIRALVKRHGFLGILIFAVHFFLKLYENYQRSNTLYQERVARLIDEPAVVPKDLEISSPAELLTISWTRTNILSANNNEKTVQTNEVELNEDVSFAKKNN